MSGRAILGRALLVVTASAAACTPATFEHLTGGGGSTSNGIDGSSGSPATAPDAGPIVAPRPISPLSVSWINGTRPTFRWENAPGQQGGVVEVSPTRDFATIPHTFKTAAGNQVVADTDLAKGIWFWRLKGLRDDAPGDKGAVVWEFLVRGPGAGGTSDSTPTGTVVDVNADGEPDFAVTVTGFDPQDPSQSGTSYWVLLGQPDHTFSLDSPTSSLYEEFVSPTGGIAGGSDVDGDGFSDLVLADAAPADPSDQDPFITTGTAWVHFGDPTGEDLARTRDYIHNYLPLPEFTSSPLVQMAGDVNGDGYGDVVVSLKEVVFTTLGSPIESGLLAVVSLNDPSTPAAPIAAGCDLDGDGLADVALGSSDPESPIGYSFGAADRFQPYTSLTLAIPPPPRASAIAMGDFDGDGHGDIAFTTIVSGTPAVCVYTPQGGTLKAGDCWLSTGTSTSGWGVSLIAGDLDADGKDDLVVGSTSGLVTLTRGASGFVATPIVGSYSPSITTIFPGRPDFARWAAVSADGTSVTIFKGAEVNQVLKFSALDGVTKVGPSIR